MEIITLKLETDYEKTGNSSGQQIDALSIAIDGRDYEDVTENSLEWMDENANYARKEYNHETDFLDTLSKDQRIAYAADIPAFDIVLAAYTEDMEEKSYAYELDEAHPYAVAIQEARDSAEESLRHEWLYGDRSNTGLLGRAEKHYGRVVEFSYDEKTDTVTVHVADAIVTEWVDDENIDTATVEAVREYLSRDIYHTAQAKHAKHVIEVQKRREEYARTRAYQAERAIAAEKDRQNRILGV